MATRDSPGTTSFNSCSRFASSSAAREENPVTFPPGCARFVTIPLPRGVADGTHDDGYRRGGLLRGEHGVGPPSKNDVYVEADEIVRQLGKPLVVSLGVAVLEANILTLDIPEILESLSKRVDGRPGLDRQDTDRDYFPSRPLRTCGERPSSRTADQSDELAAVAVGTPVTGRPRADPYRRLSRIRLVWGFLCQACI